MQDKTQATLMMYQIASDILANFKHLFGETTASHCKIKDVNVLELYKLIYNNIYIGNNEVTEEEYVDEEYVGEPQSVEEFMDRYPFSKNQVEEIDNEVIDEVIMEEDNV